MSSAPDADELAVRDRLLDLIDGPTPDPPALAERTRDWLDDILDGNAESEAPEPKPEAQPEDTTEADKPAAKPKLPSAKPKKRAGKSINGRRKLKRKRRRKGQPRDPFDVRSPRESLLDAWARVPSRVKWLIYHATAAAVGYRLGWVTWSTNTAAWFAAGHWTTAEAWALYGIGGVLVAVYRATRRRVLVVAWAAAIPVSSVTAGVLLYGTGYWNLRIPL